MINVNELTFKQAREGHRALWDWLAKTGAGDKLEWPGWADYVGEAYNNCFACELIVACCPPCPIKWPDEFCVNGDDTGLFDQWELATDTETRKKLAAHIRDLPWKEKKE